MNDTTTNEFYNSTTTYLSRPTNETDDVPKYYGYIALCVSVLFFGSNYLPVNF
jgi:hypothetical protein